MRLFLTIIDSQCHKEKFKGVYFLYFQGQDYLTVLFKWLNHPLIIGFIAPFYVILFSHIDHPSNQSPHRVQIWLFQSCFLLSHVWSFFSLQKMQDIHWSRSRSWSFNLAPLIIFLYWFFYKSKRFYNCWHLHKLSIIRLTI